MFGLENKLDQFLAKKKDSPIEKDWETEPVEANEEATEEDSAYSLLKEGIKRQTKANMHKQLNSHYHVSHQPPSGVYAGGQNWGGNIGHHKIQWSSPSDTFEEVQINERERMPLDNLINTLNKVDHVEKATILFDDRPAELSIRIVLNHGTQLNASDEMLYARRHIDGILEAYRPQHCKRLVMTYVTEDVYDYGDI